MYRFLRRRLWLAVLALLLPAPGHAETLYDAIALAYQTNPTLRAQRAELRATDEGYVQARAADGPTANLSGQYSYQAARVDQAGIFGGTTTSNNLAATGTGDLSIVQQLYTGGQTARRIDAASADILAGRQNLRATEGQVLQNLITAYVDVRRDQQIVSALDREIKALSGQLAEVSAKDAVRQATRTDVAQAKARLLAAKAQALIAHGRLNSSRAEYLAIVGQYPGELAPEPDLASVPDTVDKAFDAAEHNNPGLLAAIDTELGARARVAAAKAAYRGTLSLRVDASMAPVVPYDHRDYDRSLTGAVVFSQPLFTSGLNASEIREALERDNHDMINIETARRATVQAVAQAWEQLTSTRAALTVEQEQIKSEQAAFEGNKIEERVGLRTTIDVLNAEQELENAEVTFAQAHHDEYVARAVLLNAMGVLEAQLLIPNTPVYRPEQSFHRVENRGAAPWEKGVDVLDRVGAPREVAPPVGSLSAGGERPKQATPLTSVVVDDHPALDQSPH
jgi:outer membrane protein